MRIRIYKKKSGVFSSLKINSIFSQRKCWTATEFFGNNSTLTALRRFQHYTRLYHVRHVFFCLLSIMCSLFHLKPERKMYFGTVVAGIHQSLNKLLCDDVLRIWRGLKEATTATLIVCRPVDFPSKFTIPSCVALAPEKFSICWGYFHLHVCYTLLDTHCV